MIIRKVREAATSDTKFQGSFLTTQEFCDEQKLRNLTNNRLL